MNIRSSDAVSMCIEIDDIHSSLGSIFSHEVAINMNCLRMLKTQVLICIIFEDIHSFWQNVKAKLG